MVFNDSAAYDEVVFVEDYGLSGRDSPHGLAEVEDEGRVLYFGLCFDRLGLVANAGHDERGLAKKFGVAEAEVGGLECGGEEVVVGTKDHFVGLGAYVDDMRGVSEGDAEAFALANGVVGITLMLAKYPTLCVDEVARADETVVVRHVVAEERAVVVVSDEADLLGLFLLGECGIAMREGQLAHFEFGEVAQGEDCSTEILLGQHPEKIGLVLAGVCCGCEVSVSAEVADARIVACCDIGATEFICHAEEFTPFDVGVAEDAGIGRAAMHILVEEVADDALSEGVAEVDDMVLYAHFGCVVLGLHDAFDRAAAFLAGEAGFLDAVEGSESDAHDLVALLLKEHGADGRVYTAGHSE